MASVNLNQGGGCTRIDQRPKPWQEWIERLKPVVYATLVYKTREMLHTQYFILEEETKRQEINDWKAVDLFKNHWLIHLSFAPWAPSDSNQFIHYRKVRLIESNAKCRYIKNVSYRDFAAGVLAVWGPIPFYCPILPPLTHCIRVVPLISLCSTCQREKV